MLVTNLSVKGRVISIDNTITYAGKYNVDTLQFHFSDENWNELDKTCVFTLRDGTVYKTALLNDMTIIPAEVYFGAKGQAVMVGAYGLAEDETILDTIPVKLFINEGVYKEGLEPENLPTMTQWDEFVAEANSILNDTRQVKADCQQIYTDLGTLSQEKIAIMNGILADCEAVKADTQQIKTDTQGIYQDCVAVRQDVADMGQALTFATFDIDPETGVLYMNTTVSLGNMVFSVDGNNGALYVTI